MAEVEWVAERVAEVRWVAEVEGVSHFGLVVSLTVEVLLQIVDTSKSFLQIIRLISTAS